MSISNLSLIDKNVLYKRIGTINKAIILEPMVDNKKKLYAYPYPATYLCSNIFVLDKKNNKIMMTVRGNNPCKNKLSLPGGYVDLRNIDNTDKNVHKYTMQIGNVKLWELDKITFASNYKRDPRGHTTVCVYYKEIVSEDVYNFENIYWISVDEINDLPQDMSSRSIYVPQDIDNIPDNVVGIAFDHLDIMKEIIQIKKLNR